MRNKLFLFFVLISAPLSFSQICSSLSPKHDAWIKELRVKEENASKNQAAIETIALSEKNKMRVEDVEWLKGRLNSQSKPIDVSFLKKDQSKCKNCFTGDLLNILEEPKFQIFISFSVPDNIWCSLSQDLAKIGGSFVLVGLPNNSFSELSEKIIKLKKMGVDAQIQIDPIAFKKYQISKVPTFVVSDDHKYDKISGCISVEYALNYLSEKGEVSFSKSLQRKLRGFHD